MNKFIFLKIIKKKL